jgi:hypothetical protein
MTQRISSADKHKGSHCCIAGVKNGSSGLAAGCLPAPDVVAKVFLGRRTKILRAADALRAAKRFTLNRPRTFVSALASVAAVGTFKHRLSREFLRRSIFDFCNSIPGERTSSAVSACLESATDPSTGMAERRDHVERIFVERLDTPLQL